MQVLQIPETIRPWLNSLPPLHRWPAPVKRAVLWLAVIGCLVAYLLLLGGLLGLGGLLLQLVMD